MTPAQFLASPKAQDAVFNHVFGHYAANYGPAGAATAWFAGHPNAPLTASDGYTSVGQYVNRFVNGYQKAATSGWQAMAQSLGTPNSTPPADAMSYASDAWKAGQATAPFAAPAPTNVGRGAIVPAPPVPNFAGAQPHDYTLGSTPGQLISPNVPLDFSWPTPGRPPVQQPRATSVVPNNPPSLIGGQPPPDFSSLLARVLGGQQSPSAVMNPAQQAAINSPGTPGAQGAGIVTGPSGAFQNNPDGSYTSLLTGQMFNLPKI